MRIVTVAVSIALTAGGIAAGAGPVVAAAPLATPAVDMCFDYRSSGTKDDAANAAPVACDAKHTAQTFYTRSLPDSFGIPKDASARKKLKVAKACTTDAMNAYLGLTDTRIPSRFQVVTVFPSKAQWQAGERWMRCDVVLRGGKAFNRFTGTAAALVASTPREQFNFCTPSVPGSRTKSAFPCTKPKQNWIMVAEKDLGNIRKKFPGIRSVERNAKKVCQRIANKYTVRKKFYPWWAIWPTRAGWQDGDRTAQCFVPYEQYLKTTQ